MKGPYLFFLFLEYPWLVALCKNCAGRKKKIYFQLQVKQPKGGKKKNTNFYSIGKIYFEEICTDFGTFFWTFLGFF